MLQIVSITFTKLAIPKIICKLTSHWVNNMQGQLVLLR